MNCATCFLAAAQVFFPAADTKPTAFDGASVRLENNTAVVDVAPRHKFCGVNFVFPKPVALNRYERLSTEISNRTDRALDFVVHGMAKGTHRRFVQGKVKLGPGESAVVMAPCQRRCYTMVTDGDGLPGMFGYDRKYRPDSIDRTNRDDPNYYKLPGDGSHKWEPTMTVRDAIVHSSNIVIGKLGYDFVHFESPDKRGVDCALLYRKGNFEVLEAQNICVSDTTDDFYTRDILLVGGVLSNNTGLSDTCYILVNHWPSKRGGAEAEGHRMTIAQLLRHTMDSLQCNHPAALVLAMGDFNASSNEETIRQGLGFAGWERNPEGFYNLMCQIPQGEGSYKYKDTWSCIDQVIANRKLKVELFAPDFLLVNDEKYLGRKPFRTYTGMTYLGGYSDHLPIMIRIP